MSKHRLVRTALIVLLACAGSAALAQAAAPLVASSPALASTCSTPAFLLALPGSPAPNPASPAVCACGDAACNGHIPLTSCGTHRVCVATGSCISSAAKSCACVTQDPPLQP